MKATMNFDELKEGMRVKWGESEGRIVKLYTSHAWAEFKNTIHVPENLYIDRENVQYIVPVEDEKEEIENIPQTSPSYYDIGGISVNDVIRAKLTPEEYAGWCKGNILKYTMRAKYKEDEQKDLKKAADYMRWLIESKEGKDNELHPRIF